MTTITAQRGIYRIVGINPNGYALGKCGLTIQKAADKSFTPTEFGLFMADERTQETAFGYPDPTSTKYYLFHADSLYEITYDKAMLIGQRLNLGQDLDAIVRFNGKHAVIIGSPKKAMVFKERHCGDITTKHAPLNGYDDVCRVFGPHFSSLPNEFVTVIK